MIEEFTSLAVAYLLEELDPAARAQFEAQLAADPTAAAEFKQIAETLGLFAGASAPAKPIPADLKQDMLDQVLRTNPRRAASSSSVFGRIAWPLAAAILLALNIAQWLHPRISRHRPPESSAAEAWDENRRSASSDSGRTDAPVIPVATKTPRQLGTPTSRSQAPAGAPSIRQTVTFTIVQTTVTTKTVQQSPAENAPPQHGALELHDLPKVADDRSLYLWARRAGADNYEPVGEVPRQIYGGWGTINYQLRPGKGAPVHFIVTVEPRTVVPATPSREVVCAGP